ncbi:MAG: FG-GAP-like repeat-containing protein [Planctomycetota bacterium JB042]
MRRRATTVWLAAAVPVLAGVSGAGEVVHLLQGTHPSDGFGAQVAGPGDLDGDGVPDVLVAWHLGASTKFSAHSGADASALYVWDVPYLPSGPVVDGAGDFDADGFADAVLREGPHVSVRSGKTGAPLLTDAAPAMSVARGGDLDQDGFDDVLIGGSGEVVARAGPVGAILRVFPGLGLPAETLGRSCDSAGDFDGDGWLDVVAGAPFAGSGPYQDGYAAVFSGLDASLRFVWLAPEKGFALDVAGIGDVNGDGRDDVAVNVDHGVNSVDTNRTYVYAGPAADPLFVLSDPIHRGIGRSISPAGDVDGDGRPDVLIGGYNAFDDAGAARVCSGRTGATLLEWLGTTPKERVGSGVALVGDLDGNATSEIVVGAPDVSGTAPGHAFVLSDCVPFLVHAYGAGCPGAGGFVPALDVDLCPIPGGVARLRLVDAAGGAPALVLVGSAAAALPLGGGCSLLLQPVLFLLPVTLGGAGAGAGSLLVDVPLPPGIAPGQLFLQAFVLDPASPVGTSSSNGISVTVP